MKEIRLTDKLTGLAEECCELAQAALKLYRVFNRTNPTPWTEEDAINRLEEEIADIMNYLDQIPYSKQHVEEIMKEKKARWEARLQSETDEPCPPPPKGIE